MSSRLRDILFSSFMLGVNLLLWRQSLKPEYADIQAQDYGFSPNFFPQILLSIWAVICVVLIVRALLIEDTKQPAPLWGRLLSAFILTGVYVLLVGQIGFLLASIPFAGAFMLLFGYRKPIVIAAVTVIFPIATWWIFTEILKIYLPISPWFTRF
ncbi:MAG: tripartite tricarboxylate transporter TctB family protein [Rhodospirillales bacterium]|mgnify:CR=1 FL=1